MINSTIVTKAKQALIDLAKYLRDAKGLSEEADTLLFISDHIETIGSNLDDFRNFMTENNIDFSVIIIHKYNIRAVLLVKSGYFRFLFDLSNEWLGHEVKVINVLPPIPPV